MIEISKELQELYATDGVAKTLKIYINDTDTVISNEEISSESFTLTEILSDEEQITYGLCNSSKVEFTTIGNNAISEGTVLRIVILIGDDLTELPLGTYIVDSAKKQTNKQLKNVIAYDRLYDIDSTDMIYFYDKTVFPLTLKQLRDNFFSYVGIICEDTTLLNDNLTVNEYNDFRDLSARQFLTQICELNAVFGKMSRNDTFQFLDIVKNISSSETNESSTFVFCCDDSFSLSLPPLSTDNTTTGTIDWGDGTTSAYVYGYNNHSYENGGEYTVTYDITEFQTTIGGFCSDNTYIKEAYLSEGIETISAGTFYCASNLESVHIPSTAKVDNMSFTNCTSLRNVIFGNSNNPSTVELTQNSTVAFNGCENLATITYYTDDTSLIGISDSTYFQKSDTDYITVNYVSAKKSQDIVFNGYPIRTVETENFETKKINRIKVIESGGAVLYNIGEGNEESNYYNIKDNFLLTGRTADDETLQNTINALYTKMSSLYYTPCTITAKGLPYLETGDLIQITKDNQTIRTYILSRTLKGTIALTDTYTANGVNTLREVYSAEESISQNVYNNYQSNRLNYITSQNGERIILPTERTNVVNQKFGNTNDLSNFEYMAVITATIEVGGNIQFEYRVDGETLDIKPMQSAYSPTSNISTYSEDNTNVTYQQIVLYLPQTNSAIGTHTFEIDVISNATGYIDRNHWVSCWKGQNLLTTDKAVVSITIVDLPNKLTYSKGEKLDLTGLVVCANYVGGAKKILSSSEYTVTADTSIVGTQPVVITYNENPKLTATFDIEVNNEYLKVYESYVEEKFLESYETQSVYTSVRWVHEVNGVETETYLSTSELQSWECETLEPYYYTDSDKQYVGYYQIPVGSGFGQHDMKITYKSPDTGNILSVEYPIYYLEEIDFINNLTEVFDWYPFRHPFGLGESTLPYNSFSLYYNCYDKKGNLIEEYATINTTPENLSFEFPTVSTGQFKFEENQKFGIVYVSETLKTYSTTMIVNVRPYYDERNTSKQFDNIETEVLVNQVEPFKIGIDLNTEEHLYYDDDGNTVSKALDIPEFQMPNYISNTSRYQGSNANLGSSSSFGYIYWGDGTFSRYCAGQKFISNVSVSNSSSSANLLAWQDVKWRNGYYVSNDSRLTNFENNMFENYHRYEDFGEYSIEITNGMYRGVGNFDPSSHNEALMVFGGTDDSYRLFSGKNQHNNDYTILAGDNMYAWHITSIDFGKSAMYWWYKYTSSGTNQYTHTARTSRGTLAYPETVEEKILAYENCFQFLFGLKSVRFSNKSCALRGYTDLTHTAQESAFNSCSNLTDIYIEKTKKGAGFEDVESISRLEFSNHISGMFELNCNDIATLHFTDGDISIQD